MTIKAIKEVEQRKTKIARITILEQDGTETVINVSNAIHFIFGFAQADTTKPSPPEGCKMEVMASGSTEILGEIFYQIGNANPKLVHYCFSRDAEGLVNKIVEKAKASGVDPLTEALKKMPVAGDGRAN